MKKNINKAAGALLLMTAVVCFVTGCSSKKDDSVKRIQEAGVLKVALINSDNAYTSLNGSAPVGKEPELISSIAGALGVTVDYQIKDRDEVISTIAGGMADIAIGCINDTSSLEAEYLVSTPYGRGFFYAVTEKGDYAQTIGALHDSVISVDSDMDEVSISQLYQAGNVTVKSCDSADTAAKAIKDGTIRAYICYESDAKELLKDSELQVQNLTNLEPENYVIVSRQNNQGLISGIDVLIRQFLEKE